MGLSALGRPAVVLFPDPKQAATAMVEAGSLVEGGERHKKQRGRASALREGTFEHAQGSGLYVGVTT